MRRRPVDVPADPVFPEWMQRCVVEEWLDGTPALFETDPMVRAWGRWRRARVEWADENEMDRRELPPMCRPVWRRDLR